MSVTSVEALEALPIGTTIEVAGRRTFTWNRTARGWESEGAVLSSDYFSGHVAAGHVRDQSSSTPTVGQWWTDQYSHFLLTNVPESGSIACLVFQSDTAQAVYTHVLRRTNFRRMERSRPEQLAAVCTPDRMVEVVTMWATAQSVADQRTQEVRTLKNRPDPAAMEPQVQAAADGIARATEALRIIGDTLRNGQTVF